MHSSYSVVMPIESLSPRLLQHRYIDILYSYQIGDVVTAAVLSSITPELQYFQGEIRIQI